MRVRLIALLHLLALHSQVAKAETAPFYQHEIGGIFGHGILLGGSYAYAFDETNSIVGALGASFVTPLAFAGYRYTDNVTRGYHLGFEAGGIVVIGTGEYKFFMGVVPSASILAHANFNHLKIEHGLGIIANIRDKEVALDIIAIRISYAF